MTRFQTTILAMLALSLFLMVSPVIGGVYMYIDENGVYHFTDTPNSSAYVATGYGYYHGSSSRMSERECENLIQDIARAFGVRRELVKAVIKVESDFNPSAVSQKGARGLMQLMPVHIERYNIRNPFDPRENITAGTRYLSKLLKRYDGNLHLCLAAYNAGPTAVDRYKDIPPYPETRQYVQKVLAYYHNYRNAAR